MEWSGSPTGEHQTLATLTDARLTDCLTTRGCQWVRTTTSATFWAEKGRLNISLALISRTHARTHARTNERSETISRLAGKGFFPQPPIYILVWTCPLTSTTFYFSVACGTDNATESQKLEEVTYPVICRKIGLALCQ